MCSQLNLSQNELCGICHLTGRRPYTAEGITAITGALRVNASLTSCNVLSNQLDVAAANSLVEAVKGKNVSLCGLRPDQTTADLNGLGKGDSYKLKPADAICLASDLSKAGVTAELTKIS